MGNQGLSGSSALGSFKSPFSDEELDKILQAFQSLDLDKDGLLRKDEFMVVENLEQNPLVDRVLDVFDSDGNGGIDFKEFIKALSIFAVNTKDATDQKLLFAFKIYDVNGDGYISNSDLFYVLKIMVGQNLEDEAIQQLVDRTILYADKDKDGRLSFEEFRSIIEHSNLEDQLIVDFSVLHQNDEKEKDEQNED